METLRNHKGKIAEQLGMSLGQGLGNGINTFFANKALDDVVNDPSLKDKDVSERMGKLQSALSPYGEIGQNVFKQRMQIEEESFKEKKLKQETEYKKQFGKNVSEALVKAGYPKETADLWQMQIENSTTGGLTDTIKAVNELLSRSPKGRGKEEGQKGVISKPEIEIPGLEDEKFELDFQPLREDQNLTNKEKSQVGRENSKILTPLYEDTTKKLNALDNERRDLKTLVKYNETPGALPTGAEKWNVDWDTGELRVKAAATPEAQDYVKTIARMARQAKEFFPGRVTNFDLEQFKAGFATLANDPEGRKLILEQLNTANRIAYLEEETLKAAIDHYGSNADPIQIRREATKEFRRLKGPLEDNLKSLNVQAEEMKKKINPNIESQRPSLEDIFK